MEKRTEQGHAHNHIMVMGEGMNTIINAVIAAVLGAGIISLIIILRFFVTVPVAASKDSVIYTVITARGEACELESAVKGLLWLIETAHLNCRVIIADSGLLPEGRRRAELIAGDSEFITLCPSEVLGDILTEKEP